MATTATSLSIVKELKRLASIPTNRQYMLRNDVNSLLIFVDPDEQPAVVVIEALQALRYLAQEAVKNEKQLNHFRDTVGLQLLLEKIQQNENCSVECKKTSTEILFLTKCNARAPINASGDHKNSSGVITRAGLRNARRNKDPVKFLGGNKKAKVIVLQVEGLENESLVHAIYNTRNMTAKQVTKNECGEEVLVSFDDANASAELPPYLEEDGLESPTKEDDKKSIARHGYTEAIGSFAASWFGSVVNAVNKNLYW